MPVWQKARQASHLLVNALSVRVGLWLHPRLRSCRLIPVLTYQANRSRMCETDLFRKNPATELFPEHHSQKTEQSNNGRGRAFHSDHSIQNADKQAHGK